MADGCRSPTREAGSITRALNPSSVLTLHKVNQFRALRVAEVMNEFRTLQHQISQTYANPDPDEYYEIGYDVLRQCRSDAQALLSTHFDTGSLHVPGSPEEEEKQQLQQYVSHVEFFLSSKPLTIYSILLDASARRLQAQKIYLKAVAATRWVSTRATILQGQKPHAGHMGALQQAEINLRAVGNPASFAGR